MSFDRDKSLEQLEGEDWGEPTYNSGLVTECHRLRKVPLRAFTAENLRIAIGQRIGLPYLVPLALELLRDDPFVQGDLYKGDLLSTVLRVEGKFWRDNPELRRKAAAIAERAFAMLPSIDDCDRATAHDALTAAHHIFQTN